MVESVFVVEPVPALLPERSPEVEPEPVESDGRAEEPLPVVEPVEPAEPEAGALSEPVLSDGGARRLPVSLVLVEPSTVLFLWCREAEGVRACP